MHQSFFRLWAFAFLVCAIIGTPFAAKAGLTLSAQMASDGSVSVPVTAFGDNSGARSVAQAQAQFKRLSQAGQAAEATQINLGKDGSAYWLVMTVRNDSANEKWWFDALTLSAKQVSPLKSIAVYDPASASTAPLVSWTSDNKDNSKPVVSLLIKPGNTVIRYFFIETYPGISAVIAPSLKTQDFIEKQAQEKTQKMLFFWLAVGAAFSAGIVQLLLTYQPVQGLLALNAAIIGTSIFIQQRPELLLGAGSSPVTISTGVAGISGIFASIILWAISARYKVKPLASIAPIILNIAAISCVALNLHATFLPSLGAENLPVYLQSLTGIILIVLTGIFGLININIFSLLPAWLAFTGAPWLNDYSITALGAYLLLLSGVGVASVFWHWQSMDKETEVLQLKLRQELGNSKIRHKKETDDWTKKLESQRVLLNELRGREQQRSAELEVATKEAEAANKAKSDFLAIISHEIRTPMNGIMGIVQMINQTPLNETQSEYIDVIKNSGETMLTLLNDILDYSKIEKGIIELEFITFSLRKLVKSVATLMSGRANDKGLDIIIDIDPTIPDSRTGDPSRIRQILLNLVGNAIKFTEKGSVTIRITPKGVEANNQPAFLFEIIDTGMGISPQAQEKLFQAYVQADASISRRFGGTGLGLNICRMLTQAMEGTIGVSSIEGTGSTFWFSIPLAAADIDVLTETKGELVTRQSNQPSLSILVIDDNSVNLKVVSGLLEMDGHQVTIINSAEKALEIVDSNPVFNLIFVDIMMPGMDGKTFLKHLQSKADPARASIPVFALTGVADQESIDEIIGLGMRGVITKPVMHASLQEAIYLVTDNQPKPVKAQDIIESFENMSESEKAKILQALAPSVPVETPPALAVQAAEEPIVKAPVEVVADETFLNMGMLGELKSSLPPETLNEIFVELIDKAKELTAGIEEARDNRDFKALGAKAHDLRGMGGNFGMQKLMEHNALIEHAVRNNEHEKAASHAMESRLVLDQSLAALDAWLKS